MSKTKHITLIWGKGRGSLHSHSAPLSTPRRKYPAVSSERERSRYVAVFQDQYAEFLELQQEVRSAQAKLQQLEALLTSLPAPRSQVSNQKETIAPEPFQVTGLWPPAHLLGPGFQTTSSSRLGWHQQHMSQHQPLRSWWVTVPL